MKHGKAIFKALIKPKFKPALPVSIPFAQPSAHEQGGYSEEEGDGTRFMTQILEPAQISGQMEASELRDLENVDLMFAQNGCALSPFLARARERKGECVRVDVRRMAAEACGAEASGFLWLPVASFLQLPLPLPPPPSAGSTATVFSRLPPVLALALCFHLSGDEHTALHNASTNAPTVFLTAVHAWGASLRTRRRADGFR